MEFILLTGRACRRPDVRKPPYKPAGSDLFYAHGILPPLPSDIVTPIDALRSHAFLFFAVARDDRDRLQHPSGLVRRRCLRWQLLARRLPNSGWRMAGAGGSPSVASVGPAGHACHVPSWAWILLDGLRFGSACRWARAGYISRARAPDYGSSPPPGGLDAPATPPSPSSIRPSRIHPDYYHVRHSPPLRRFRYVLPLFRARRAPADLDRSPLRRERLRSGLQQLLLAVDVQLVLPRRARHGRRPEPLLPRSVPFLSIIPHSR
jgi:hypothetical protein